MVPLYKFNDNNPLVFPEQIEALLDKVPPKLCGATSIVKLIGDPTHV